jgi:toluene monooxygenase system ferredoxin subunit
MLREVARLDELWSGEMRGLEVAGQALLLINLEGKVLAFADCCAHQGIPLSRGRLERGVLTCSAHAWQYDAASGEGINPRGVVLRSFPVEVRDGAIWVDL